MSTAWLVLTGNQVVRDLGDLARFGALLFQLLAPLQLAVACFFSALFSASSVAQEKDRKTLDLLLMTRLSNVELVLGKLCASLLHILVLLAASVPLFALITLFGGVSLGQVWRVMIVTAASVLLCGTVGSTVAFWREKTFQALAVTALILVVWLGLGEALARGLFGSQIAGWSSLTLARAISPWQAVLAAAQTFFVDEPGLGWIESPIWVFVLVALGASVVLNLVAIGLVRRWTQAVDTKTREWEEEGAASQEVAFAARMGQSNPAITGGGVRTEQRTGGSVPTPAASSSNPVDLIEASPQIGVPGHAGASAEAASTALSVAALAGGQISGRRHWRWWPRRGGSSSRIRHVWNNPVIWREICTRAYGRRTLLIRAVYYIIFACTVWLIHSLASMGSLSAEGVGGLALVAFFFLSLVLVNIQAVSSLIAERDGRTLDLLLVTDLTPKEFVYGKLGGTFYNAKEMVLFPLALCWYLWFVGGITLLQFIYLVVGLIVLFQFVAMLGIHVGMIYATTRGAIATSLGTVFFLFVGVATCIRMMIAFSGRFEAQLPFLGLIIFGGAALYLALGVRNPSTAIGLASFACPLLTFYAITSFFLHQPHLVFVAIVGAYGFATLAMLIPAIDEFDVVTGRTTVEE